MKTKQNTKYFSPFANVLLTDCRDVKGTFGTESSNKWKPWNYQQRVHVAKLNKVNAVEKISEKTKRSKIKDYIA